MFLSVAVFLLLLWSFYKIMLDIVSIDVSLKTIFLGFTAYMVNISYYYFLYNFMPLDLLLEISLLGISAFGITHMFLPLVGLIISWLYNRRVE